MEEKKDINSLIGFTLMGAVMLLWLWLQPIPEEISPETIIVESAEGIDDIQEVAETIDRNESLFENKNSDYNFDNNTSLENENITSGNDSISLEINKKGGFISNLYLKGYNNHLKTPIYLINNEDEQSVFNLKFKTKNNRLINTSEENFTSSESKVGDDKVIVMKLTFSEDQYLEFEYQINADDYMIDFSINSNGLSTIVNTQDNYELTWDYKSLRNSKSISYENRYSRLTYEYE